MAQQGGSMQKFLVSSRFAKPDKWVPVADRHPNNRALGRLVGEVEFLYFFAVPGVHNGP